MNLELFVINYSEVDFILKLQFVSSKCLASFKTTVGLFVYVFGPDTINICLSSDWHITKQVFKRVKDMTIILHASVPFS